jgi:hypothetical protein
MSVSIKTKRAAGTEQNQCWQGEMPPFAPAIWWSALLDNGYKRLAAEIAPYFDLVFQNISRLRRVWALPMNGRIYPASG